MSNSNTPSNIPIIMPAAHSSHETGATTTGSNTSKRVSSDASSTTSSITIVNHSTASRLQRLPTPPRSPGLAPLGKQLTVIKPPMTKGIRFLILDCPTDSTLPFYLAELKRNQVTDVVRCCEPTYRTASLLAEHIMVHDWPFRDGAVPPANIIKNWLQLVDSRIVRRLRQQQLSGSPTISEEEDEALVPTIAVHCVAGLGRAPILVAIALIELGMANLDTVEFIRRRRRGCFNSNQITYIDGYKRNKILKHAIGSGSAPSSSSGSSFGSAGVAAGVKNGLSKVFRLKV
ncbi:Protein tyrosine phosphatase type IVA 1 [Linnemannia schmuckeri]|uniref:protein-tyrosine-phosphatase n=1 Tax=Linnemannia schmuckeri TaxID=64567 RepID=A0A9P5VEG4_9FUNG|nr:Protein tyrosine phosphatase type IVA 1 [Linnemannia schmuckeri]